MVERQIEKSAAALLLESRIGESFDAIVTRASAKGAWVCPIDPPVEERLVCMVLKAWTWGTPSRGTWGKKLPYQISFRAEKARSATDRQREVTP